MISTLNQELLGTLDIRLLTIERTRAGRWWSFRNVISPFARLWLILDGRARVRHHGRVFHQTPGQLHLAPRFKMYVAANNPKYFCRKCRNKIPIVDLENIIRHELNLFFNQPQQIAAHLAAADQNLAKKSALLEAHKREIQKVPDERSRTHKLYLQDQITPQGFGDLHKPAEARLNQLQAELPKLEADVGFLRINKLLPYSQLRHPTIENRCQPDHHFQLIENCFSRGHIT